MSTEGTTEQSADIQEEAIETGKTASIKLESLTKEFDTGDGTELVFDDIDLTVEPGSFVSLLGKSGSGKSTMLNIISGILDPTEGDVWFERVDSEKLTREEVTLGHVFQSPRLLPWETCLKNIEFVHENNPDYTDEIAKTYLDMVGLGDHYHKYPTQLSGGQRQRVGIARGFSIDPDVLLMDEPFSNLDEITAEDLRLELLNIWEKLNKTVFFVTHDIVEAIQLSDRILMLGDGEIYADLEIPIERPREVDSEEFLKFRQRAIDAFHSIDE